MASRGYNYGGASGAGGKIRRRPPSRAAAASPYARPASAPAPTPAAAASQRGGWLSRIIAAGASRLLPSLFRKPLPQLAAPPPPPVPLEESPLISEPSHYLLPELRPSPLDAPPSPSPPPLEDDLPEGEETGGVINNPCTAKPESSDEDMDKDKDMLRNADDPGVMYLEELLNQKTFTRSEFDYLSELLWSRTIGSSSLKLEGDMNKVNVLFKENGSRYSNLPVDLSYTVPEKVASPAEIAKAYMDSKSYKGSPLRLRLHDPSSLPVKSVEANMIQKAKPPTIPLLQGSRLHTSKTSVHLESNYATPNRSAIYKMSSSPYFKNGDSSKDFFGSASSSYQTPSSVHTFGRQVLKRKSTAVCNETASVGPLRKMHQRYSRTSPLLETRLGYRRYLGGLGSKLDEDSEQLAQTQKRRCMDKVGDDRAHEKTFGGFDDRAHEKTFGQAPLQSAEMAAKILKQLDTLLPQQKEDTQEIKQKHGNATSLEDFSSQKKKDPTKNNLWEPSPSEVEKYSLHNGTNGTAKLTPSAVTEKGVDATSSRYDDLISSNKDKPPAYSLRSHAPSNLVLSSEHDPKKLPSSSNGFTFPVPDVLSGHSQAPPTPTMASSPDLPIEKEQLSTIFSASVTSVENGPRILNSVSEEVSNLQKSDSKLNTDDKPMPSMYSGQCASSANKPIFKFVNSSLTTLSNGPGHALNSAASAALPSNGSTNTASFSSFGSSAISTNSGWKSTQSSSPGGNFTFSSTGMYIASVASHGSAGLSSKSVKIPSLASSGTGSNSAPFIFSPLIGTASSLADLDKSKAVSSSTHSSAPQMFGSTASSSVAQDESKPAGTSSFAAWDTSKVASPGTTISGNQHALSKENSPFKQSPANNLSFNFTATSNCGSLHSSANPPVGSGPFSSSPYNSSPVFPLTAGLDSTSVAATAPPSSPAASSVFGSTSAFSSSPMFSSTLTTAAQPSFGVPNTGLATSPSSAVFSFTSATPSVPSPSPSTPISGGMGSTVQMNGGNMIANINASPFSTASPFGIQSSSPSTPVFSTPATQFSSNTAASPGIFQFSQQSQTSSGGFSMGLGGGNDKSSRRIIKAKRRK